ncbi:UvrABC system protein C [Hibiscus syriacus]|uniref:UvrABC system protein C n=1 Tax=Hibiscus syriacus TaxID=106335 RepID=A0A6A3AHV7_HIBSY|nr:UvrABC system protein C [Hibiscus syriacus]
MGNWFGRSKLMVKLFETRKNSDSMSSPTRIKVRMTKTQLKELKAHAADTSKGKSELGQLIIKECLEGRLSPRVVVVGQSHCVLENSRLWCSSLRTITEERI